MMTVIFSVEPWSTITEQVFFFVPFFFQLVDTRKLIFDTFSFVFFFYFCPSQEHCQKIS